MQADSRAQQEDHVHRLGEPLLERVRQRRGQRLDERGVALHLVGRRRAVAQDRGIGRRGVGDDLLERLGLGRLLELVGDVAADGAEQDGQEHRHTQRAADLAEEGRRAGGDADLGRRYGALHDQQQRLHAVAEPDAEHQHEEVDDQQRGVGRRGREQQQADHQQADPTRGTRGCRPVRAMMLPETDGAGHHAEHHRQHQQPGLGRRRTVHDLHVQRQDQDAAEHRGADRDAGQDGHRRGPDPEQPERDQRSVAHRPLGEVERHEPEPADDVRRDRARPSPSPTRGPARPR